MDRVYLVNLAPFLQRCPSRELDSPAGLTGIQLCLHCISFPCMDVSFYVKFKLFYSSDLQHNEITLKICPKNNPHELLLPHSFLFPCNPLL